MPPIFVWAAITDPRGVLLVPTHDADVWVLPGAELRPEDETVEAALVREIEERFGVRPAEEPEFLDTAYERLAGGATVVHNLFHVPGALLGGRIDAVERREWLPLDDLDRMPVPTWLRRGLGILFGGEEAEPAFDFAQIEAALDRVIEAEPVILVTGPAGAGKSSVARELCRRFPRAAHIDVDLIRWRMVVSGYVRPEEAYGPQPEEALRQLALAARNAAALARNFVLEGFLAVIDDVIETRELLDVYLDQLSDLGSVYVITLLPNATVLATRDAGRSGDAVMGSRSEELRRIIAANGETRGIRLDTSGWTVEETVDVILERQVEAQVAG
jgi:ADP-ribose pyrophosphatase YjhB (NUDIX family)/chloramphenicol 3-O-phosphotransferase